jgi:hypothetical protein
VEWAYLVGLGISLVTLVFGALGLRGKAQRDYVDLLKQRLDDCERELRRLQQENQWLRRQLMDGGKHDE